MEYGNKSGAKQEKTVSRMEELYERWRELLYRLFPGMTVKERFLFVVSLVFTALTAYYAAGKGLPFLPTEINAGLIRPLGDGILCAVGGAAPAVFLALIVSTYASGKAVIPRIALLSALFLVRTLIGLQGQNSGRHGFYRESSLAKIAVSSGFSLLCTAFMLPTVGVSGEALPILLLSLLLTPLVTALLCGALGSNGAFGAVNRRGLQLLYGEISRYFFFMLTVYAFVGQSFMGSDVSVIIAIFLTVTGAYRGGVFRGGILGALLGLTVSVRHAPITAVVGIFAGVLSGLGIPSFVWLSCLAGCLLAAYAYGYRAVLTFIPDSIIATAVTAPVIKYGFLPEGFPFPHRRLMGGTASKEDNKENIEENGADSGDLPHESERSTVREISCASMLGAASEALEAVSGIWGRVRAQGGRNDACAPDPADICERLKSGFCDSCPLVCICWDKGNKTAFDAVKTVVSGAKPLESKLKKEPEGDGFRCIRAEGLADEITRLCGDGGRADFASGGCCSFVNTAYASEILRSVADTVARSVKFDRDITEKAQKAVSSLGLEADGVAAYGGRIKTVVVPLSGAESSAEESGKGESGIAAELTSLLSADCGLVFSRFVNSRQGTEGGFGGGETLIFSSEPQLSVSFYCAQRKAAGEERNGDSASGFVTEDGFFNFVLCDGMGSGEEAANCSENAVNSLKKLLECRISPRISAKLTGDFVKDGYEECFTTLDLLTVDLASGRGEILKSGAACSYLLRGKTVRRLGFPSLPLGLSYDTDPEGEELLLKDGDVIVMVSDGMADDEEDERVLSETISRIGGFTPEVMAERLISDRLRKTEGEKHRDDMTVAVVKIKKRG